MTANPELCAGCGDTLSSTRILADGKSYHVRCMPDEVKPRPEWDPDKALCGNCRWWPLSLSDRRNERTQHLMPTGIGGHQCNGTVSPCLRRAPAELNAKRYPSHTAQWPTTARTHSCGEFERRAKHTAIYQSN